MLTEIDLKRLGIKKLAHRRNLHRRIQTFRNLEFPLMFHGTLARGNNFGGDPNTWLETVGLADYKASFRRNHIKTVRDIEALKSFTEKEIREDLHITKPGHIQGLKDAIERLWNPQRLLLTEARNSETVSISRINPDKSRKRKGTPGKTPEKSNILTNYHSNDVYSGLHSVVSSDEGRGSTSVEVLPGAGVISGTKLVSVKLIEYLNQLTDRLSMI
uniref:Uncharacterized protein LOC111116983 n=1 Tax=Crassostrea virginica TaxID=6565 RepID=A0A8B8C7N8_CRAVI|nr:uncharacterized protein LOC111116983 [Crassostrea virginica]XP_022311747.1 uncharacterized protein LOC111116983 [Crassostrea virginica]